MGVLDRVRRTVALLEERGYAVTPERIGRICYGGPVAAEAVQAALAATDDLHLASGLVVTSRFAPRAPACRHRSAAHADASAAYRPDAVRFSRRLVALAPFVLCVAIAGSLSSGGFVETDDIDLNLVVEDGYRHLAYVVLNLLGVADAVRRRRKPVDASTRRPLAPRVMTANLVLERSQCFPLARSDAQMALELLQSEPVFGASFLSSVVAANPVLCDHFPQLAVRPSPLDQARTRRLPAWAFPSFLDPAARVVGEAAWRWMMWTRRRSPEALGRVAYVRETMRPYALFERHP